MTVLDPALAIVSSLSLASIHDENAAARYRHGLTKSLCIDLAYLDVSHPAHGLLEALRTFQDAADRAVRSNMCDEAGEKRLSEFVTRIGQAIDAVTT